MRSKFSSLTLLCLVFTMSTPASAQDNRIDMIRSDAPSLAAYSNLDIGVKIFVFKHEKQIDVLNIQEGQPAPLYDRPLTTEVWYPATIDPNAKGLGEYSVFFVTVKHKLPCMAVRCATPSPIRPKARIHSSSWRMAIQAIGF